MALLGIDEVGRGPLAGPLVVGAVILPEAPQPWHSELKDSKKLTAKKRTALSQLITTEAITGLGWVPAAELDQLGISGALRLATRRAVEQAQNQAKASHTPFSEIIIDGKVNFLDGTPLAKHTSTLIKADAKIPAVSAASIIAKVARDQYMIDLATKYPLYHFDQHVGYGTRAHVQAIYQYGLTPEHRKSFEPCKSLAEFTASTPVNTTAGTPAGTPASTTSAPKDTTTKGRQAEQLVADYLAKNGHTIIAHNHKTYFYEIDLISIKGSHIYFTEVKYRESPNHGTPLTAITPKKLAQMHFAATSYLKYQNTALKSYQPLLAAAAVTGSLTQSTSSLPPSTGNLPPNTTTIPSPSTTIDWFPLD